MSVQSKGTPGQTWDPTRPWIRDDKKTQKIWPDYVCRNPSCRSMGRSHPGCMCGAPATRETLSGHRQGEGYARGGKIHFCSTNSHHHPECEHFADGGQVEAQHEFASNPELALDHSVVSHGLLHLLTKTGHTKSEDPARVMGDHLEHAMRGRRALQNHSKKVFEKSDKVDVNKSHAEALKAHIEDLAENPHKALDIGGSLGSTLPDHAGALGAKTAAVLNHFKFIKPFSHQGAPLDEPTPPTKSQTANYDRQFQIAQNPASIYNELKSGTIQPSDLNTIQAIYPKLYQKMMDQTTESLIEAKTNGTNISRKHKAALGSFLGQPLDYSRTPEGMQQIIAANGPMQGQQQNQQTQQKKRSGATGPELKQLDKVDQLYKTPLEQTKPTQKS